MKQLKTILISSRNGLEFQERLEKFLKTDIEGSVQYRVAPIADGGVLHSALVIYAETPQEKDDV